MMLIVTQVKEFKQALPIPKISPTPDIGIYVSDVHTIAVIKAQESYKNIKEGFRDIIEK